MRKLQTATVVAFLCFSVSAFSQTLTEQDLVGDWHCESVLRAAVYQQSALPAQPGWQLDESGLMAVLKTEWHFRNGGSESYSLSTTSPNPVDFTSEEAIQSEYRVKGDSLIMNYGNSPRNDFYAIKKADDHLILSPVANGFLPVMVCDRVVMMGGTTTTDSTTATTSTKPVTTANAATPAAKKPK